MDLKCESMKVFESEAIKVHGYVYSRMNFRRSRLANDYVFFAEAEVATFGGIGVWFTPLQNSPCD